jgi:hypothetical protein
MNMCPKGFFETFIVIEQMACFNISLIIFNTSTNRGVGEVYPIR